MARALALLAVLCTIGCSSDDAASPPFALKSPNGGELWVRGVGQSVTWTPTGQGGSVRIEVGHMGTDPAAKPEGEWTGTTDTLGASCASARCSHRAVWTGSRMIVWGGDTSAAFVTTDTGAVYDPATDTWESATDALGSSCPTARLGHVAVWTGSRMIVWGGAVAPGTVVNTGAVYDPDTDTWESATDTLGALCPSGRGAPAGTWAGSRMLVWGGNEGSIATIRDTGAFYDPSLDAWDAATAAVDTYPIARYGHTAVWTGSLAVIWGGCSGSNTTSLDSGALYDPGTPVWVAETAKEPGVSTSRHNHSAVWTGSRMIVWGGTPDTSAALATGAIYDPDTDTWTGATDTSGAPGERWGHSAVWTGTRMIVWGGTAGSGAFADGATYDPPGWHTVKLLADATPDDGAFDVSPADSATLWTGAEYRVRVTHLASVACDDSDADFTISE